VRPKEEKDTGGKDREKVFVTVVLFGNRGEWLHRARARLAFEDGTVIERVLPGEARWVRLRIRYRSRLAWAAVDPDGENAWEWNRLNDSIVLGHGKGAADTAGRRASVKYFAKAAYFVGLFLQAVWALA
jgi:hypothetical protein